MVLSACGGTPVAETPEGSTPVKGGTWRVNLVNAPGSLIPTRSSTVYSAQVAQAVWAPLLYSDQEGAFHPALLEEVPSLDNGGISADYKTWKLKFKEGLLWSDGEVLDAHDWDFSWRLNQNPDYGASATAGYQDIVDATVSADGLEITMTLERANATFITTLVDSLNGSPVPEHIYSKIEPADFATSPENHKPSVSSGPFIVESSEPGVSYQLVPNENFFLKDEVYLDRIIFEAGVQGSTILQNARAGTLTSTWNIDPLVVEEYRGLPNYEVVVPKSGGFEGMFFNLKHPALQDVNVRKAISMAIDRAAWTERVRKGLGVANCTVVPSTIPAGYDPEAPCPEYDIEGAKTLLDENGWEIVDGVREKDGVRLEFPLISNQLEWRRQSLLYIQSQLNQLNISTEVAPQEGAAFFDEILPKGDPEVYGIAEFGFILGFDPDPTAMAACSQVPTEENNLQGQNYSFYCNEELDALLEQQISEVDTTARQAIFKQIHEILLEDLPFIGLAETSNAGVVKNTGQNYSPAPMGSYESADIYKWWCTGGQC